MLAELRSMVPLGCTPLEGSNYFFHPWIDPRFPDLPSSAHKEGGLEWNLPISLCLSLSQREGLTKEMSASRGSLSQGHCDAVTASCSLVSLEQDRLLLSAP